jgi:prepilin-type processing-associated H-X9-DG protein
VPERDRLFLYDREPRHLGGRNVLFADGTVTWLDEPEFQKRLAAQIAAAAKAGGASK